MTKERLEELGWQFDDFWANRALFSKKNSKLNGFAIFEHNGDWGIINPYSKEFELIYCNMTDKMVEKYINFVNQFEECYRNSSNITLKDYLELEKDIKNFIEKMKKRG